MSPLPLFNPWLSPRERARLAAMAHAKPLADLLRGRAGKHGSSRHQSLDIAASLAYVQRVYTEYCRLLPGAPAGQRVLELGCGDSLAVGLCFLADGAAAVTCTDRFPSPDGGGGQAKRELLAAVLAQRGIAESELRPAENGLALGGRALEHRVGVAAEDLQSFFAPQSFDLIISRAVLEHVSDVAESLAQEARALAPGGRILHRVDLRGHGLSGQRHPLGFLTLPESYQKLNRAYGYPNRERLATYTSALTGCGLAVEKLLVTRSIEEPAELDPPLELENYQSALAPRALELVRQIRPSLPARFAGLPDWGLAITGFFLSAQKPA